VIIVNKQNKGINNSLIIYNKITKKLKRHLIFPKSIVIIKFGEDIFFERGCWEMKREGYKFFIGLVVIALTILTLSGCGKNVVGPTAPESLTSSSNTQALAAIDPDAAEVVPELSGSTVESACHHRGKKKWSRYMYHRYLFKFRPWRVKRIGRLIIEEWFDDPDLTRTICNILSSRLFYIVTFRCGVGPLLFIKSLKILSQTWFPGLNTNPQGCDPEVTLLPYRWNLRNGFYGDRLPGWTNGNGYQFQARTPEQDYVSLETKSYTNNIYQNETPIFTILWRYVYFPLEYVPGERFTRIIRLRFSNAYWDKKFIIHDSRIEEDHEKVAVEELWASTENKSARCKIVSYNTDLLNIDLQFDETGAGGGTVDIKNWWGKINHYEFVVYSNGHGYYTKNGGRKRRF